MEPGDTPGGPAHGSPVVGPSGNPMMMADLDATEDGADKSSEKWRRVVHSLLWWMQARKLWAHLGQRLNQLSGLKMDDGRWLKWALRDK